VAIPVLPELHVPPLPLLTPSVVVPAGQTLNVPVIVPGSGFTTIGKVTSQPTPVLYVMVTVPAATPVTIPVPLPTVAVPVAPLLQIPPLTLLYKVVVPPSHTLPRPVIAPGAGFIVTIIVVKHPLGIA
jgi:hypothetical protein